MQNSHNLLIQQQLDRSKVSCSFLYITFFLLSIKRKGENVAAHDFASLLTLLHLGIYFTHQTVWLTAADSLTRTVGIPTVNLCNYYSVHWKTGHCKYMSWKTIAFWAMMKVLLNSFHLNDHTRVLSTDLKVRTTLNNIINSTRWQKCSIKGYSATSKKQKAFNNCFTVALKDTEHAWRQLC